jgi:hypothetical protein
MSLVRKHKSDDLVGQRQSENLTRFLEVERGRALALESGVWRVD